MLAYDPLGGPKFCVSRLELARRFSDPVWTDVTFSLDGGSRTGSREVYVFKTNPDNGKQQILVCHVTYQSLIQSPWSLAKHKIFMRICLMGGGNEWECDFFVPKTKFIPIALRKIAVKSCWEHEIDSYASLLSGTLPGVLVAHRSHHFVTDEKPRIERDESLMANKHRRSSELDQTSLPGRQC